MASEGKGRQIVSGPISALSLWSQLCFPSLTDLLDYLILLRLNDQTSIVRTLGKTSLLVA